MIHKTEDIDFSSITRKSDLSFITFQNYWWQYCLLAVVFIGFVLYGGVLVFGPVIAGVYFTNEIRKNKKYIFKEFATINGWVHGSDVFTEPPLGFRWAGHSPVAEDAITGEFAGTNFVLYKYLYTTGHGKYSSDHPTTVIEFQLSAQFPYMLLDSKANREGAVHVPLKSQKLSLEGDFDSFFQLYAQENEHVDVLSVITPDVMLTSMQSSAFYDIEIFKDRLYIYVEGDHRNTSQIKELFRGAEMVLNEINHKAKSFRSQLGIEDFEKSDMKSIRTFFGISPSLSLTKSADMMRLAGLVLSVMLIIALAGYIIFVYVVQISEWS